MFRFSTAEATAQRSVSLLSLNRQRPASDRLSGATELARSLVRRVLGGSHTSLVIDHLPRLRDRRNAVGEDELLAASPAPPAIAAVAALSAVAEVFRTSNMLMQSAKRREEVEGSREGTKESAQIGEAATRGSVDYAPRLRRNNAIKERSPRPSLLEPPQDFDTVEEAEDDESTEHFVERARFVRRATIALRSSQNEAMRHRGPALFDRALIIRISEEPKTGDSNVTVRKPRVIFSHPEDSTQDDPAVANSKMACVAPQFFYPDFMHIRKVMPGEDFPEDDHFIVALSNHLAYRTFAYCVRYVPQQNKENEVAVFPRVFVLLTPLRSPSFFLELARHALQHVGDFRCLRRLLTSVRHLPFPQIQAGFALVVVHRDGLGGVKRVEIRERPSAEQRQSNGMAGSTAGICPVDVLRDLTPEYAAAMVLAVLFDLRVLIAARTVQEVTRAVRFVETILQPFQYPHTFIPCVPDDSIEICHLPAPYIIGVLRCNLGRVQELVVDQPYGRENDDRKDQTNLAVFDVGSGIINPLPRYCTKGIPSEQYREKCAVSFCSKTLGVPKAVVLELIKQLRRAAAEEVAADDYAAEPTSEAMLTWFAKVFGHYSRVLSRPLREDEEDGGGGGAATSSWKRLLLDGQDGDYRVCLQLLVETTMFDDWIHRRVNGKSRASEALAEIEYGPVGQLVREYSDRLDDIYAERKRSHHRRLHRRLQKLVSARDRLLK